MQAQRIQLLEQALELSRRMGSLGEEGDWEQVIELEPQRRAVLEQAFATRAPVDESLAQRVHQILELDRRLMDLSLQARDRAAGELGQLNRSRKARNAYAASAR